MQKKILDFISGLEVQATAEEIEAVQVFSKQLVEDYGYSKQQIITHPQFRVKSRPSDKKGKYPVDIAVFHNVQKQDPFGILRLLLNVNKKIEQMAKVN